ncbi:MAG: DUF255 domain-containing protein [Bacteroidales bacterium]|nr:DUF255 domain-containing protein [Bacteroidales bacterium]
MISIAESRNKLIFLDCYTTWCGPCKGMASEVFTDKIVGEFMNGNFICTKRDMEKGEGVELNTKYKSFIPGYPTYLLINSDGEVIYQAAGYMKAEKFIQSMKEGLERKSWIIYKKRFDEGERSLDFVNEFLKMLETAYQNNILEEVRSYALNNITFDLISNNKAAYDIFRKYWTDVTSPVFKQFMSGPAIYRKHKDPESEVNNWAGRLYERRVRSMFDSLVKSGINSYDLTVADEILADIRKSYVKDREELIARILVLNSIAENKLPNFFDIVENARSFGLLRNYSNSISSICREYFKNSNDKKVISKCLKLTQIDTTSNLLLPEMVRNYAFFVGKSGDTENSKILFDKAEAVEKDLKEKFGGIIK